MAAKQAEGSGRYLDPSRLTPAEAMGVIAGGLLAISLFLPWFGTSMNPNSRLAGASMGGTVSAFEVFDVLRWLLLAAATAPLILMWIVARAHRLTWRPGEVTMVVGATAFVLVLCNGIVLGRPEAADGSSIEISLAYGYFVGLVAALLLGVSGYVRQSFYSTQRKPPGVI